MTARDRLHARPLEALDRKVDAQRHQPLQRRTRLFTQATNHGWIDAPLIDLRVVVEHRLRRIVDDAGCSLHARTGGEEPSARQRGRPTQLRLTLEEQHARAPIVRGDRGGHAGGTAAYDDDVVVGHRWTLSFRSEGRSDAGSPRVQRSGRVRGTGGISNDRHTNASCDRGRPVHDEREIEAVLEVLRSGLLDLGPRRRGVRAPRRRAARQAARRDGQLRHVGPVAGRRPAGLRAGRRGHHVTAHVLERHRPAGAQRDRARCSSTSSPTRTRST